jgi:murein DD-endopeptidase MepM/ murein hydrolase activator NlpD
MILRRATAALVALALPLAAAGTLGRETFRVPSGPAVTMSYRALQPGEPLLFALESEAGVREAEVTFLGKKVILTPAARGGRPFALLGIDLGTSPGPHPLDIKIATDGGKRETLRTEVVVLDRKFPTTKLTVRQDMVTPPRRFAERIKREAEIIGWVYAKLTPEWLGDGPFAPPSPAEAFPNFGQRRLTNGVLNSIHGGVDVLAPFGTPITAANAGRVVLASDMYLTGYTVIIDHGLGIFSLYCHLSKLDVKRGVEVRKGDVIGKCGSTGRSTGPHLHWAVRVLDSRVDPYALLVFPLPEAAKNKMKRGALPQERRQ